MSTLTLPALDDALKPLGFTLNGEPIWPVFGSERNIDPTGKGGDPDAEDDDEADDEDDADDDSEDDEEGGDGKKDEGEWKPPTKEEWERTQRALKRANGQARKHRQARKQEGGDDAAQKAVEAAEKKFKPVAVRSAAKASLLEAGLNDASDARISRLLKMIDMDEVDVDEDGDVNGLDDQIDAIKDDFPALFEAKKDEPKRKATKLDASGRKSGSGGGEKLSVGEKIARQMLGSKS